MTDLVLDLRHLRVQFFTETETVIAVDGIDLQLKRGQTLGIVGESGSGKSMTSLGIMGLVPEPGRITGGEIWFAPEKTGEPVNLRSLPPQVWRQYRGGEMAMIFQEPMSALNPVYTIGFQLTEAIELHQQVTPAEARRLAIAALQEVRLLPSDAQLEEIYRRELQEQGITKPGDREVQQQINQQKRAILKRYPHELSGGQLQRVTIAMAIACHPTLLLADEPTTALDVTVQATILELLRELSRSRQMTMIFITHDLGIIAEIADRVAVMYKGKIVETGDIASIFENPQHPYTKGLIACRPRLDRPVAILPTVEDFMEVVKDEQGLEILKEKTPPVAGESSNLAVSREISPRNILEVKNLSVGFPIRGMFGLSQRYLMAVKGVSFTVREGETLGLVGESGCGKSTLARTILRLIPEMHGEIIFEGESITSVSTKRLRLMRRQMQIIFQNPYNSLNPRLTVGKAIQEPLEVHKVGKNEKERRDRVTYLLQRVGLNPDWVNRYPHEFSGGQRQRICIARALALNPRFIICDESVSALDVSVQAQVLNLLKELQAEFGLTYIFVSHDLSVVKFMSDRIMVMNQGCIEEIDEADEIYEHPKTEYTRKLIAAIPTGKIRREIKT